MDEQATPTPDPVATNSPVAEPQQAETLQTQVEPVSAPETLQASSPSEPIPETGTAQMAGNEPLPEGEPASLPSAAVPTEAQKEETPTPTQGSTSQPEPTPTPVSLHAPMPAQAPVTVTPPRNLARLFLEKAKAVIQFRKQKKLAKIIGTSENSPTEQIITKKPKDKTTILFIEDDITLSQIASERLRHEGYQVYTVFDGPDGLAVAANMHPDLILLDIIMPVMNGFEVLKRLKEDPKLKSIPVIIFSNLAQEKDKIKARELGATDYLVKANFTPALLVERIAKILN